MESKWLKPITTRRYIHCPKAERMYTLWSEGKIIFGEMMESFNGEKYWDEVPCSGIWFTYGDKKQFDFKTISEITRLPIKKIKEIAKKIN